jgi:hypothetical protein
VSDETRRRCIVVAPFYPPSGMPPAHRARLFVRHLASFGWTPIVVTVDPRDREEAPEAALERTLPPGVRTERVRALPARWTRRIGIGDLALRALPGLARRAVRVARESGDTVVLLIVPPWYGLWLAPLIAWRGRVPVVVDYVDPWRIQRTSTLKSRVAGWLARTTEGVSLRGVSGVFAVADQIVADLRVQSRGLRSVPAGAAPYGFEASDWALVRGRDAVPASPREPGPRRIVYVGAISDAQVPVLSALLDAMAALRDRDPKSAAGIRLELYGTNYAASTKVAARAEALVRDRHLEDQVIEKPARVPYTEALRLTANADVNLVLGDTTRYYAASKLMPVLSAQRPILALLHASTEPAELLTRLGGRGLVCYGTSAAPSPSAAVSAVTRTLIDLLDDRIPVVIPDFTGDPALANRTAEHMTAALASVLDQVSARRGAAA